MKRTKTLMTAVALLMATSVFAAPPNFRSNGQQQSYRVSQRAANLSGVVQRINYRNDTLTLRENGNGRVIHVDMANLRSTRLRSGQFITLSGNWERGNTFAAYRIDTPRGGRY